MGWKGTPGPWFGIEESGYNLNIRGGSHHYPIAQVKSYWDGPGPRKEEALVNMAGISLVPDMVEALKAADDCLEYQRFSDMQEPRKAIRAILSRLEAK